jgi:hypothetical protein
LPQKYTHINIVRVFFKWERNGPKMLSPVYKRMNSAKSVKSENNLSGYKVHEEFILAVTTLNNDHIQFERGVKEVKLFLVVTVKIVKGSIYIIL